MQLQIDAHGVGYDTRMSQLLEWSPLIVFFVTFELTDIYWATAALMIACVLRAGRASAAHRQIQDHARHHDVAWCWCLGTATLLLHDQRFIQWKPTVLLALTAAAFLGSMRDRQAAAGAAHARGRVQRTLGVSARTWLLINALWAVWFARSPSLNLYVARNFAESLWVNFKVFGIPAATMLFMIPQVFWLSGKTKALSRRRRQLAHSACASAWRAASPRRNSPSKMKATCTPATPARPAGTATFASGSSPRRFAESPPVARHRLVYAAVDDLMKTDIHALAIEALPPGD